MKMQGVLLPGGRRVEFKEFDVPEPGHGQVLIKMKASSICGSDIRAIYREHLGHGPLDGVEALQQHVAGVHPGRVDVAVVDLQHHPAHDGHAGEVEVGVRGPALTAGLRQQRAGASDAEEPAVTGHRHVRGDHAGEEDHRRLPGDMGAFSHRGRGV